MNDTVDIHFTAGINRDEGLDNDLHPRLQTAGKHPSGNRIKHL